MISAGVSLESWIRRIDDDTNEKTMKVQSKDWKMSLVLEVEII